MRARRLRWLAGVVLAIALLAGCDRPGVWIWEGPSRLERQAIESRYSRCQKVLEEKRFAEAYAVMSPRYRAAHAFEEFAKDYEHYTYVRLEPGNSLRVHGNDARLYPYDDGWFEIWNGPEYQLERVDGQWYLTGEVEWYVD